MLHEIWNDRSFFVSTTRLAISSLIFCKLLLVGSDIVTPKTSNHEEVPFGSDGGAPSPGYHRRWMGLGRVSLTLAGGLTTEPVVVSELGHLLDLGEIEPLCRNHLRRMVISGNIVQL